MNILNYFKGTPKNPKVDTNLPQKTSGLKKVALAFKFAIVLWALVGIVTAVNMGLNFIATHDFRSPIVFQNPMPLKKMETPVAKKHAVLIQKVFAQEITPREAVKVAVIKNFGINEWDSMEMVLQPESNFNPYAINPHSGACGIFQANPCSKLPCYLEDIECQINWGMNYISQRYGSPSLALAFRIRNGWY